MYSEVLASLHILLMTMLCGVRLALRLLPLLSLYLLNVLPLDVSIGRAPHSLAHR